MLRYINVLVLNTPMLLPSTPFILVFSVLRSGMGFVQLLKELPSGSWKGKKKRSSKIQRFLLQTKRRHWKFHFTSALIMHLWETSSFKEIRNSSSYLLILEITERIEICLELCSLHWVKYWKHNLQRIKPHQSSTQRFVKPYTYYLRNSSLIFIYLFPYWIFKIKSIFSHDCN